MKLLTGTEKVALQKELKEIESARGIESPKVMNAAEVWGRLTYLKGGPEPTHAAASQAFRSLKAQVEAPKIAEAAAKAAEEKRRADIKVEADKRIAAHAASKAAAAAAPAAKPAAELTGLQRTVAAFQAQTMTAEQFRASQAKPTMARAEWQKLSHGDRAKFFQTGGKLVP